MANSAIYYGEVTDSQESQGNVVEGGIFDMGLEEWMEVGQGLSQDRGECEHRHRHGNLEIVVPKGQGLW